MAIITKSVGSAGGRDYSTLQAAEDAITANLVAADESWVLECYNDSEFVNSAGGGLMLFISGQTTDATHTITVTAAAGQSFQDHASVRTNPLAYNPANGVALKTTGQYGRGISCSTMYFIRIRRLQFKCEHTQSLHVVSGGYSSLFQDLIIQQHSTFTNQWCLDVQHINDVVNVLAIRVGAGPAFRDSGSSGFENDYIGCAAIRPSDVTAGSTAFASTYATGHRLVDCASFGFTTCDTNGATTGSSNNATDLASGLPGSSNQHSVTYSQTTPFTDADKDSLDLRAIAATSLAGNGLLDGTNAPNDISGFTRPAGPTIGAWQLGAAAAGLAARQLIVRQAAHRASYF